MWKDLFYLTKREKAAVWTLTVLVVLAQGLIWSKTWWMPRLTAALGTAVVGDSLHVAGLNVEEGLAVSYESTNTVERRGDAGNANKLRSTPPRPFNPNRADSLTLRQAGLSAKVVSNLLKYRRKAGSFSKPADVARIYGMTSELMAHISPSLVFETPQNNAFSTPSDFSRGARLERRAHLEASLPIDTNRLSQLATDLEAVETMPSQRATDMVVIETMPSNTENPSEPDMGLFELNSADTTRLQCLKGVGPVTANRIIRYRQQLGGYYHVAQLAEIKGLYPDVLDRLQASLTVDPTHIVKLNLNKASLEKLKTHPYLNFYQAKVIVELRKARKGLSSLEELAAFNEFTPADLDRLKWYVTW
ncbi:MAG: helix-hairpin-helix domain-containing protein [Bacteroidales bacterium]|nr:helix-hairpin-helix domain-containing protein [Bacteroidales bacterium]